MRNTSWNCGDLTSLVKNDWSYGWVVEKAYSLTTHTRRPRSGSSDSCETALVAASVIRNCSSAVCGGSVTRRLAHPWVSRSRSRQGASHFRMARERRYGYLERRDSSTPCFYQNFPIAATAIWSFKLVR